MHGILIVLAMQEQERRKRMRILRRRFRDATNPFEIPEERFRVLYRLSRDVANLLMEEMRPYMSRDQIRTFIPISIRLCAALHFYATGSYNVGQEFSAIISPTMAYRMVMEVSEVLGIKLAAKWIKFPRIEEYDEIKERFFEETGFPGVIAVIDCTHVRIQKPNNGGAHCYLNSKGYYSKNIQLICDYDLKIFGVFARFGGSTEDDYIWEVSQAYKTLKERYEACKSTENNSWLIGDSAYPLSPWLITPYNLSLENDEQRFNEIHLRALDCLKRLSGTLKSVFRCLKVGLRVTPQASGQIINACCALHNFRLGHGITHDVPIQIDLDENDDEIFDDEESCLNQLRVAMLTRDRIKTELCS